VKRKNKQDKDPRREKNKRVVLLLAASVLFMIALAYASVPLYTLFCRATGLGGTTQRVADSTRPTSAPAKNRVITVSFDGNVDPGLPWDFAPEVRKINLKLGETATIKYRAHNRSHATLTGTATYNVQPDKAGAYFDKIQCFCFTNQTLKPGETAEFPVQFYVDPALAGNTNTRDVTNITLSYTFYLAKNRNTKAAFPSSSPLSKRELENIGQ